MVATLDRKVLRDLWQLRGQAFTIALVVASGIATLVCLYGTWRSLNLSRDTYYAQYRFADLFASLRRAPLPLAKDLETINGVSVVYPRVVGPVRVALEGTLDPPGGQLVSIPDDGDPPLNGLHLRAGRHPGPGNRHEALLLESFAQAHGVRPGDTLPVLVLGQRIDVLVVGLAMSPEFVFPPPHGGMFSDPERFAVLWMRSAVVGPLLNMEGGFNDLVVRLGPKASQEEVRRRLEDALEPYGNTMVVGQDMQASNNILNGEMSQLQQYATVAPAIFLGVAAFLLNVVLSRLVLLQRQDIASLKAMGYSDAAIGLHFLKLVVVIVLAGALLGSALGIWLGWEMTQMYTRYFRFPVLTYSVSASTLLAGFVASLSAALFGALLAVRRVVRLPPAQAMRPPAPVRYKRSVIDRLHTSWWLDPASRMVLREVLQRPLRALVSILATAMAVGIMVVGRFSADAIDQLMTVQFFSAWREDMLIFFDEPKAMGVTSTLESLPGVLHAEGARTVAVRFRNGSRWRDGTLIGYPPNLVLRQVVDAMGRPEPIPATGVMLTAKLAEVLELNLGDTVQIDLRERERRVVDIQVTALADEPFGLQGTMTLAGVAELMREQPALTQAMLRIDPSQLEALQRRLGEVDDVAGVLRKETIIKQFREQSAALMRIMSTILTLLASTIAVGVVYNNARIALSMRSRELASLRVLGFTRREISSILLGELAVQMLLAIPIGMLLGYLLAVGIAAGVDPEQYRIPVVISSQTYAFAVTVTLLAGALSALLVRRKLDHLDLVEVLKTRE